MDVNEMERELLLTLLDAATAVCQWDYEDLDPEPKSDMEKFKKAVEEVHSFQDLRKQAEATSRAKMYRNVAS